jgi:hypothetical protein
LAAACADGTPDEETTSPVRHSLAEEADPATGSELLDDAMDGDAAKDSVESDDPTESSETGADTPDPGELTCDSVSPCFLVDGTLHVHRAAEGPAIRFTGFEDGDGEDSALLRAVDENYWIWQLTGDSGIFWAGWDGAAFDTGTDSAAPKEVVFVGDGDAKAAIDLKNGDAHFNTVHAREIVVESTWADYVFDDDYRLRPLAEVETFIADNGHLPDVPSAKQVQGSGVRIGESQANLLRKIEELTLYTLAQQRTIEAQAAALAAQEATLSRLESAVQKIQP